MEQISVSNNSPESLIPQDYTTKDINLLNEYSLSREFGAEQDVIEFHIFSNSNQLLNTNYDFKNYSVLTTTDNSSLTNTLSLDPERDTKGAGYTLGKFNTGYFFYRNLFLSSNSTRFFIKEISGDRTEIRISTNDISYNALGTSYFNYLVAKQAKSFYSDFLLNFGNNNTVIGVNSLLDTSNEAEPSLFIKLYEPLPAGYNLKDTLWVAEEISDPISFNVDI